MCNFVEHFQTVITVDLSLYAILIIMYFSPQYTVWVYSSGCYVVHFSADRFKPSHLQNIVLQKFEAFLLLPTSSWSEFTLSCKSSLPAVTLMTILSQLSNKWILCPCPSLENYTNHKQHTCSNTVVRTSHVATYRQLWHITFKCSLAILCWTRNFICIILKSSKCIYIFE
jgi:hypothetical protein